MKKFCSIFLIFIMAIVFVNQSSYAKIIKNPEELELTAKSAAVYSNTTGELVASKNGDEKLSPYSITKLMTALIIAENHKMDEKVIISAEAAKQDGSSMEIEEGEEVTVEELLNGLLILSGNDAAYTLAEYDSGIDAFAEKMNKKAKELGCTNTHFVNPSGLKADGHYTSANDFVKIANAALANKDIAKIAGALKYKMPATNKQKERIFETHLDQRDIKNSGVIAGKTGYWEDDDCSIAVRYNKDNLMLTVVLIGDTKEERANDANKAFEYAHKSLESVKVVRRGKELKKCWIAGGERTLIPVYSEASSIVYPKNGDKDSTYYKVKLNSKVKAPLEKGDIVGRADIYSDGKKMESVPVYVNADVKEGWIFSKAYISNVGIVCIGIGIVIVLLTIFIVRSIRRKRRS